MNLPSSLALTPSKLLQSRLGILVLALVLVAVGGGVYLFLQRPAPPVTPTPATSPAAQALVRAPATPRSAPQAPTGPVYGPPAPPSMLHPVPTAQAPGTALVYGPPAPESMLRPAPAVTAAPAAPPASAAPASAASASAASASPAAPVAPAPAKAVPSAPAASTAQAGATGAAQTAGAASAAATATSPATVATPAAPAAAADGAKPLDASVLFARDQYAYTSGGRRDPFQSLIDGKFQGQTDASLVDVGDIHLVGIMWGSSDKFALVEDSRGHGYVLRVGDPVVNGYISGITKTELQIVQNAFGDSQTLSIHLQPKEGDKNANRN